MLKQLAVTLVGLSLMGCDDGPTGPDDDLAAAEIRIVAEAILAAFDSADAAPAPAPAAPGPARAPTTTTETVARSIPCERGGSLELTGTITRTVDDAVPFFGEIEQSLAATPIDCALPTPAGFVTFGGAPSIGLESSASLAGGVFSLEATHTGAIAYTASGGRSGTCAFDFVISATADFGAETGASSATGTICGEPVSEELVGEPGT